MNGLRLCKMLVSELDAIKTTREHNPKKALLFPSPEFQIFVGERTFAGTNAKLENGVLSIIHKAGGFIRIDSSVVRAYTLNYSQVELEACRNIAVKYIGVTNDD